MLTETEIEQMRLAPLPDNEARLLQEIERLKQYILDYGSSVTDKLNVLEKTFEELEEENARLVSSRRVVYIERDACISLLAQLARKNGIKAGIVPGNIVVVDLPSGQVSWEYHDAEAHLFSQFPEYSEPVEELTIQDKYTRVMNPGL